MIISMLSISIRTKNRFAYDLSLDKWAATRNVLDNKM